MIIRFIKQCEAPQRNWVTRCNCCGPELEWESTMFFVGEEVDQEGMNEVNITGLTFNEDFIITSFP